MSWCDKLASTAGIGIRLDPLYTPITAVLSSISPLVSSWVEKDKPAFTVEQQDAFAITLSTLNGFYYGLNAELLSVEFRHRLRVQPNSAGPPTAEMLSQPAPYTELLNQVSKRLIEVLSLIAPPATRKLLRVGVISTTVVSEDEAPPGIRRFVKYVSKPWKASSDAFVIEVTTKLDRTDRHYNDRCIHHLSKSEDSEGLITVRLDWQRAFMPERTLSLSSIPDVLKIAQDDALSYFEDVGQGDRFDEHIISSQT